MNTMYGIFKTDKDGFSLPFMDDINGENFQRLFSSKAEAEKYLNDLLNDIKEKIYKHKVKTSRHGFMLLKKESTKVFEFNATDRIKLKSYLLNLSVRQTICYANNKR